MSKTLNRMASLLAVAENEGATEAERELAFQRAQELASATGIDLAVARAHQRDRTKREEPEKRAIRLGDYVRPQNNKWKVQLFNKIADYNDVHLTFGGNNIYVWAHGFPSDIDVVEKIYAVAVVQMIHQADQALKRGDHKVEVEEYEWWNQRYVTKKVSSVDGRIWRSNFYAGYIQQLGNRLWDGRREALKKAGALEESSSTALALRDKKKETEDFYQEHTKHLRGSWSPPTPSELSHGAIRAGARAATATDLHDDSTSVEATSHRELG